MKNLILTTLIGLGSMACSGINFSEKENIIGNSSVENPEDVNSMEKHFLNTNRTQLLIDSLSQDYFNAIEEIDDYENNTGIENQNLQDQNLSGPYNDFFRMNSIKLNNRIHSLNNYIDYNFGFSAVGYEVVREEPNLITSPFASFRCYGSGDEVEYIKQEFSQATVIIDVIESKKFIIYNGGLISVSNLEIEQTDEIFEINDGEFLGEFSAEN
ncbi:hypothetical protein CL656_03070 [bacterium]|nr:hypothetical protein [bacterium]|tara:strand:+ start:1045 stop:1683 length:639 start_codon:yes stop_codon:yes gene_type:complete